jgi:hypothetical protein
MRPRGNHLVGTFVGAQPQCLKCIALCATQDVGPTELRLVQGVERGVHWNSSLLLLRGRVEAATPASRRLIHPNHSMVRERG